MKKSELIQMLNEIEGDLEVCIYESEECSWRAVEVEIIPEGYVYLGQVKKHWPEHILIS